MKRSTKHTLSLGAAILASALLLAGSASARTIRVDVGSNSYDSNGQAWEDDESSLSELGAGGAGTMPFAIDFGQGSQTGFCLSEDGTVGFGADCSAPEGTLSVLGADWASDPAATRIFHFSSVTYTQGRLDAAAPFTADPNDAPQAVRFHWNLICTTFPCNGNPDFSFQAILIDVDGAAGGDFDIEFNYGGSIPAGTGVIGFALGDFTFSFSGDVENEQSFDFQFRGGRLIGDVTEVPEPATLALLALALLALPAFARRRVR